MPGPVSKSWTLPPTAANKRKAGADAKKSKKNKSGPLEVAANEAEVKRRRDLEDQVHHAKWQQEQAEGRSLGLEVQLRGQNTHVSRLERKALFHNSGRLAKEDKIRMLESQIAELKRQSVAPAGGPVESGVDQLRRMLPEGRVCGVDSGKRLNMFTVRGLPPNRGPIVDFVLMARASSPGDDVQQTLDRLLAGNIEVGIRAAQFAAANGVNVGVVYTCERIAQSRDGILQMPVDDQHRAAEVALFWTMEDIRLAGHEAFVVPRGYDAISDVISTKLWLCFHHSRGLTIRYMIYQKNHHGAVRFHNYVVNIMRLSGVMQGHRSPIRSVVELLDNNPTNEVIQMWDLLDKICIGKLQHVIAWYNMERNDYV
ncbi:hypothetical protein LTR27_007505 [Elasticomyces elasticus]|nr:hypothetical protein LTR27_007505 [Elasticomyces elasticus]